MLKRGLGLLGWLGVALVFAAVAISFLKPQWQWYRGLAIAGLVCTLLYILSQWREIAREFSGRSMRYGTLTVASILVVLGILAAINYLASRHNKRWDLTAAGQYTLSEQTKNVLHTLERPLRATVLARTEEFPRYRLQLDKYQDETSQLQVEYVDPEKRPAVAEQLGENAMGVIVLEYDGRVQRVTSTTEEDITNGIIKVVQGEQHKVYFVQGHDERDTTSSSDGRGYGAIAQELSGDNFTAEKLVLLQQEIPADAKVIVIAGPRTDLLQPEIDRLKAYLAKGGKLLVLLDPAGTADAPPLTNLVSLLNEWSIEVGNDAVVDPLSQLRLGQADVPVAAPPYPYHPITSTFRMLTAFPFARSVKPAENPAPGRTPTSFIQSGPASWAETDLKRLTTQGEVQPDLEGGDTEGPISLAVAVSAPVDTAATPTNGESTDNDAPRPETRIVVIGDSDFASNSVLNWGGNRDLFLNTVNWLAQQENLIAVRPRDPEDRRVTVTAAQDQMIFWFVIFIMPGLILLAGVQAWWRRR